MTTDACRQTLDGDISTRTITLFHTTLSYICATMSTSKDPEAPGHGNNNPPPEILRTDKPKATSRKQTCCMVMAIMLFMSTAVFTVLFVVYYVMPGTEVAPSKEESCNTQGCVMAASSMIKLMNATVDPCDDFSEFACGRFYKEAKILNGAGIGILSSMNDVSKEVLTEIVTEEVSPGNPQYLINMKRFYKSCLDEDKIEEIGLAPFLNDTDVVNDWPTLNPAWNGSNFNLSDVIVRYAGFSVFPLFIFGAYNSFDDHLNSLLVAPPKTILDSYYFATKGPELRAYQTYLTELAITLGADVEVAARDVKALVDFQAKLYTTAFISEITNKGQMPRLKISALRSIYPQIDIAGTIRSAFGVADITLSGDMNVYLQYPGYLDYLNKSVTGVSNRTLQNLFSFTRALHLLDDASRHLRELRFNFEKAANPNIKSVLRWKTCLETTSVIFQIGVNKQFLLKTFRDETKIYGEEMVVGLQNALRQLLNESTWLAKTTKEQAFRKLDLMESDVGYPDEYADDNYVDEFYENYTMTEDNYYTNSVLLLKLMAIENIRAMAIPDYDSTTDNLLMVNAHYIGFYNRIQIPAAILIPPLFSLTQPHFINYAAIGGILGHEIMHGFDIDGSQLDAEGYLNNWWQDEDREEYLNRTQCFVDQYSSFYIPDINMTIDGEKTVGENMPDNVGLKLAHMAYRELVKRTGEELKLPGLSLTQEQLYFLSSAQMLCSKETPGFRRVLINYDVHSISKYRILGMLQNSEEFAKAYNCSRGSYMNPEKKCTLW